MNSVVVEPTNWIDRNDLNWCYNCWFGANITSKTNEICEKFVCLNCGFTVHVYHDESVEQSIECPKFFSNKEWDVYWKKHFQLKE